MQSIRTNRKKSVKSVTYLFSFFEVSQGNDLDSSVGLIVEMNARLLERIVVDHISQRNDTPHPYP